ncbi:MAG: AraC family transcriptional regulator [Victivallaceae bacterium]|nr:AraC family transcriptional regulator [Victivallaceae bacterium]
MRKILDQSYHLAGDEMFPEETDKASSHWQVGRKKHFPLWTQNVSRGRCLDQFASTHRVDGPWCFEIPVSGVFDLTDGERTMELCPGEIYLFDGTANGRIAAQRGQGECARWSVEMCGTLLPSLAGSLFRHYRHFHVGDAAHFLETAGELRGALLRRRHEEIPRIAGLSMRFLMELAEFVPLEIPPLLADAVHLFESNLGRPIRVGEVVDALGLSEYRLNELFREYFGVTMKRYFTELRLRRAEELLREGTLSVKEIAQQLGYGAPQFFTREFHRARGYSPREFRRLESSRN